MDTANDNPSTSHQPGASASQPGNISQPENAQLAQAGPFTSQPGENLSKTLSDINVNMSAMASLLQSLRVPMISQLGGNDAIAAATPSPSQMIANEGERTTN